MKHEIMRISKFPNSCNFTSITEMKLSPKKVILIKVKREVLPNE